ncbi:MAG: formate/nitrite transporter family protein [Rubrimonas sp.]
MQHIKVSSRLGFTDGILSPAEIAEALVSASVAKAAAPPRATLSMGVLGGLFIALGGAFFTATLLGATPGVGAERLVAALMFSVGLILVVVAGAELFTGNALMLMAVWRGRLDRRAMARNWGLVLAGNAAGAVGLAVMMGWAGMLQGAHGALARDIAEMRFALDPSVAFVRGVLCNVLVCLAVWMSFSSRTPVGKIACVMLPVAAFVTLGFEHCIANLYLLPAGMLAGAEGGLPAVMGNLIPVTLGNLVGAALVAWLYDGALRAEAPEIAAATPAPVVTATPSLPRTKAQPSRAAADA